MGRRNYLVEGLSGTGKTTVCDELRRRGHHAVLGDRELAYWGDPVTGAPTSARGHENWLWDVEKVRALTSDRTAPATFFCGGARNHGRLRGLFDDVFVLEVDLPTLHRRLDARPDDEWGDDPPDRDLVGRWHRTREFLPPDAVAVDATAPVEDVVDAILRRCGLPA